MFCCRTTCPSYLDPWPIAQPQQSTAFSRTLIGAQRMSSALKDFGRSNDWHSENARLFTAPSMVEPQMPAVDQDVIQSATHSTIQTATAPQSMAKPDPAVAHTAPIPAPQPECIPCVSGFSSKIRECLFVVEILCAINARCLFSAPSVMQRLLASSRAAAAANGQSPTVTSAAKNPPTNTGARFLLLLT